jgi:ribosomal subunit interface protein
MKCAVRFKGIDSSQALIDYVQDRFQKLERFEMKPLTVHVTFRDERHERVAEIYVKGMKRDMRAQAAADNYYGALDLCFKKVERQLEKEKSRIKHHKHEERTAEYRLEELVRIEEYRARKEAA